MIEEEEAAFEAPHGLRDCLTGKLPTQQLSKIKDAAGV